jgi:glutathione synthase/RimK-type ligase-like ATP-grasp enzyme
MTLAPSTQRSIVVVGVRDERFALLEAACKKSNRFRVELVSYGEAFTNIGAFIDANSIVRFESTDENPEALKACLVEGARVLDGNGYEGHETGSVDAFVVSAVDSTRNRPSSSPVDGVPVERLSVADAERHKPETGAIFAMHQAYVGRVSMWRQIEQQAIGVGATVMNSAESLAITFDKRATAQRLVAADVSVPTSLGPVRCFDDIVLRIGDVPGRQVMVKTAHGAGATGMVALRTDGRRWHASTTAILVDGRLWNTRTIRSLNQFEQIEPLVDALCRQVVHVEHWIPKASTVEGQFDLRVVVIGGNARHVLMRSANAPFTNLHLGARRGSVEQLRARMGDDLWQEAMVLAERAVAVIGPMLYAGVDILLKNDWKSLCVLEVNGFGDWHENVLVDGMNTYEWELLEL